MGFEVGFAVGVMVGFTDGVFVGFTVGVFVGFRVVGAFVGSKTHHSWSLHACNLSLVLFLLGMPTTSLAALLHFFFTCL